MQSASPAVKSLSTSSRLKSLALATLFSALLAPQWLEAAGPVFKCPNNGSVTYQSDPCPTGEKRAAPTVEQLNAERQKRLTQAAAKAPTSTTSPPRTEMPSTSGGTSPSRAQSANERPQVAAAPIPLPGESFKCDGRIHCSQMTSCPEAKYFLSRCPGVKMDGDRDGIPCEEQWCTH